MRPISRGMVGGLQPCVGRALAGLPLGGWKDWRDSERDGRKRSSREGHRDRARERTDPGEKEEEKKREKQVSDPDQDWRRRGPRNEGVSLCDGLGVLVVMSPERADLVLSADVPHGEGDVLNKGKTSRTTRVSRIAGSSDAVPCSSCHPTPQQRMQRQISSNGRPNGHAWRPCDEDSETSFTPQAEHPTACHARTD